VAPAGPAQVLTTLVIAFGLLVVMRALARRLAPR
jgi:multisubunit Na+/H+ antiporter MnhC subunit